MYIQFIYVFILTEGDCKVWYADFNLDARGAGKISAEALTVETTAYALMAAVAQKDLEWADDAACYLATREKYSGGWKSTQVCQIFILKDWPYLVTTLSFTNQSFNRNWVCVLPTQKLAFLNMNLIGGYICRAPFFILFVLFYLDIDVGFYHLNVY